MSIYDPLRYSIEVPCSQEHAFTVFVRDMGSWWPLDKRSMSLKSGKPPRGLRVDARVGGKIVEVADDGTEHHWGTFQAVEPNDKVSMDFHMGLPPDKASLVEVTFTALAPERTRVELVQSRWENFGEFAEMMRKGYPSGWVVIFETAYRQACGGE